MNKRPTLKEFKERSLQDTDFKEAYEALRPEFELIKEFIRARKNDSRRIPLRKSKTIKKAG